MASAELLAAGMRLLSSGRWLEAESAARSAIAGDAPGDSRALLLRGLAIAAMGEDVRAAPFLVQSALLRPQADHPCAELARLEPLLPRPLVARQFRACLRLAPSDVRLRVSYADFLLDTGKPAEAERILSDGPHSAASHHMMGLARAEQSQFAAAIDSFTAAVALDSSAAASWTNLGMILKVEGRFQEAIAAHDRAVGLDPSNPRLQVNRAVALLKAGLWEPAWQDYEARLELTGSPVTDPLLLMPSLAPGDRLDGRTVLAMHEDGYGDTLQFLRYLPLLVERGAKVVALVPPPLARVMRLVPGVTEVATDRRRLPRHDLVCPMFSLPRVFGTTPGTIPPVPAITLDPDLVRHWAEQLPREGLRAGLVWAGQARPSLPGFATLDRRRSAGLASFQPLFDVPGVSFVSLQAGTATQQARPQEMIDPMPAVTDFADTAAIIAGLDVVISVDTSVVHLAGLLGKPVFLIDRYDGCWRWLSKRRDSPWYPNLTIFRQEQPGDWSGAMVRAAASLEAMAMFRGFGSTVSRKRDPAFVA